MFISRDSIAHVVMAITLAGLALTAIASKSKFFETAETAISALKLETVTTYDNDSATFKFMKAGLAWPNSSTFAIYRLYEQSQKMVSKHNRLCRSDMPIILPQHQRSCCTPWPPLFTNLIQLCHRRPLSEIQQILGGDRKREIASRPDVRPIKGAHQIDVGGPSSDSLDFGQRGTGCRVVHSIQFFQI